jgi:hypothetical protein
LRDDIAHVQPLIAIAMEGVMRIVFSLAATLVLALSPVGASSVAAQPTTPAPSVQKICSPFNAGQWRDSIVVPATWSSTDCASYARTLGAVTAQLGCMHARAQSGMQYPFVLGTPFPTNGQITNQHIPSPNCGW